MKTVIIYAAAWIGLAVLAVINGTVRQKSYGRYMSELSAHQLSTLIFIALMGAYIWFLTGLVRLSSEKQALGVGAMWLAMTISFEFLFGHFVAGHSWERLFHDYDISQGRVWLVVLFWTLLAPWLFQRIQS